MEVATKVKGANAMKSVMEVPAAQMEVNSDNEFYGEYGNQKWNRDEMSAVLKIEAEIKSV